MRRGSGMSPDWVKSPTGGYVEKVADVVQQIRDESTSPHPDNLAQLLDDIEAHVCRFIGFASRHHSAAVALWVAHCYVVVAAWIAAYLRIKSAAEESGKTTLLEILHQLLRSHGINAVSVSPSVVYRFREKVGPVALLLDE